MKIILSVIGFPFFIIFRYAFWPFMALFMVFEDEMEYGIFSTAGALAVSLSCQFGWMMLNAGIIYYFLFQ